MERFCRIVPIRAFSSCRRDGTGRRARLKIWWGQPRVGSIPTAGNLSTRVGPTLQVGCRSELTARDKGSRSCDAVWDPWSLQLLAARGRTLRRDLRHSSVHLGLENRVDRDMELQLRLRRCFAIKKNHIEFAAPFLLPLCYDCALHAEEPASELELHIAKPRLNLKAKPGIEKAGKSGRTHILDGSGMKVPAVSSVERGACACVAPGRRWTNPQGTPSSFTSTRSSRLSLR